MTTDEELALSWFPALVSGDADTAGALIADDFRYHLTGTLPASGWWGKDGFFASAQMFSRVLARTDHDADRRRGCRGRS